MTETDYTPIDCGFHDQLEAFATLRVECVIRIREDDGKVRDVTSRIVDVYARKGEEFAELESGETVRLDRLVTVERR